MVGNVISKSGLFFKFINNKEFDSFSKFFLKMPNLTKEDILEYFECSILFQPFYAPKVDSDSIIPEFFYQNREVTSSYRPTYKSEYIHVIGQLFLAGYIDFGITLDDDDKKIDYVNNLSNYKKDKYKAWVYFRDNYFYKEEAYNRDIIECDIRLYNGKIFSSSTCPFEIIDDEKCLLGVSVFDNETTWNTPEHWSHKNIWVCITKDGIDYRDKELKEKIYNKYKDISIELDYYGNISGWVGHINR